MLGSSLLHSLMHSLLSLVRYFSLVIMPLVGLQARLELLVPLALLRFALVDSLACAALELLVVVLVDLLCRW